VLKAAAAAEPRGWKMAGRVEAWKAGGQTMAAASVSARAACAGSTGSPKSADSCDAAWAATSSHATTRAPCTGGTRASSAALVMTSGSPASATMKASRSAGYAGSSGT